MTGEGEFTTSSILALSDLAVGSCFWQVKAVDNAGNSTEWSQVQSFDIAPGVISNLLGTADGLSWKAVPGVENYTVEYSADNFSGIITLDVRENNVDTYGVPFGTCQWRVRAEDGPVNEGNDITSNAGTEPQELISDGDGDFDLFFAEANGVWGADYAAEHQGVSGFWRGTDEIVSLAGKNKLADIFEGSSDANILVMTDDANGDALFVDDVFTALPGSVTEQQARIAQIDEIRAGSGDDIVDLTSKKFEYVGNGVLIRGGSGNDTIWANKGSNTLFGDSGNDRLVGASGNDVIVGGVGNDSMHGGGGDDIFCFCEDWGSDKIIQLDGGKVTLWFGSEAKDGDAGVWNDGTFTYVDGENRVSVSGVSIDNITLKFGNTESAPAGAFADFTSEKIFEENKAILA